LSYTRSSLRPNSNAGR